MISHFLKATGYSVLLLGIVTAGLRAQGGQPETIATSWSWVAKAEAAGDTLLNEEGKLILEGKILAIDLEDLQSLKKEVMASGNEELITSYITLTERFLDLMKKIELATLTSFTKDDWKNLRAGYETERIQTMEEIEILTDSLVLAYAPVFTNEKGQRLLSMVEDRDRLQADFIYRLGELYLENTELRYDNESYAWDELVDSLLLFPEAVIPPEPIKDYSLAVAQFNKILTQYPISEYSDDALYNLAYIKTQSKDEVVHQEGINLLLEFADKYPSSPYYPEVQMRLGEYYFNPPVNDMVKAIEHYKMLLDNPDGPYYTGALYRTGWAYYRDNNYPKAEEYFTLTIDRTIAESERGTYSSLLEESVENLSKSFVADTTKVVGIAEAVNFLKQDAKRQALFGDKMLKRIGDIYQNDIGEYPAAIATYDSLLQIFTTDPEMPEVQRKKIKCYELLGDKEKVSQEKYRSYELFNRSSAWAKAQTDSTLLKQANLYAEKDLRDIVRESVINSNQTKQKEDYNKAVSLCRTYIEDFPNTTETYRINYNLAVILTLDLQDYLPACVENLKVTRAYPSGKYTETCATNAVECAFRLMEQEQTGTIALPPASEIRTDIPPEVIQKIPYLGNNPLLSSEILYLSAIQNYLDLYPQGSKSDVYLLNAGALYFKHEKYEASRYYLEQLVNNFPQSSKREEAYKTILEGYFLSKDYANSERLAKELAKGEFSKEMKEIGKARVGESIFSSAKALEAQNDFIRAGSEYKRVALEQPDYQYADNSLWESARQFMNASAWDSAIVSFNLLVDKAPKSEWADKSLNNIAFIYQNNLLDKKKAGEYFEKLYDNYPKSEFAKTALSNASVNFSDLTDYKSALRVNEKYLKTFPEAEDAVEVLFENAELYLKMGDLQKAISDFASFTKRFPNDPRNVRAEYQVGKYYLDKGDLVQAKLSFEGTVKAHRNLVTKGQAGFPRYASYALAKLLDWKFTDFIKIKYTSVANVNDNRKKKEEMKKELEAGYKELINFRQSESLQAMYNMCRMEENLAQCEIEQALPSVAKGEAVLIQREEVLAKSLPLYLTAANSYYGAKVELQTWWEVLKKQEAQFKTHIESLQAIQNSSGVLAPDSQAVLTAEMDNLKEAEESIKSAQSLIDSCTYKYAKIYFDDAQYVNEVVDGFIKLPDQGADRKTQMFFRAGVLGQLVAPRAMNVVELYGQAYVAADTIKADKVWKDSSKVASDKVLSKLLKEYEVLIERSYERYNINHNSFRQRVKDEDESAYDIINAPLTYLDFCKVFIDSMMLNGGMIIVDAHKDTTKIPFFAFLDDKYTAEVWKYFQFYSNIYKENKGFYAVYDKKFGETGDDLYFEGMDLFELISGTVNDYQMEMLQKIADQIEANNIVTETGDRLLREMVKKDPMGYGYLLGLKFEGGGMTVTGNMDWKVTSEAKIDFKEPGFNDDKWRNAVMVEKVVVPAPVKSDTLKSLNPNPQDPEDFSAEPDTNQPTVEGNIIVIPADTAQGTMENTGIISAEDIVEVDSSALVVERAEADTVPPAASVADTSQKTVSLVAAQYTIVSQIGETAPVPAPEVKGPDMSALEALGVKPIWSDEAKEKLYFRYTFNISGIPVSGIVTISADDKYVLYVNGQFVGEGSEEVMSWLKPTTYTVKSFLAPRKNVVAVETSDPDLTANGLWFKMDYNTMPENIDELPIVRGVK